MIETLSGRPMLSIETVEVFASDFFLFVTFLKPHDRHVMLLDESFNLPNELVGELFEQDRGNDRTASMFSKEPPEIFRTLKLRYIPVEIEPIDAVNFQRNVFTEQAFDAWHFAPHAS